jgi:hypothetical protein
MRPLNMNDHPTYWENLVRDTQTETQTHTVIYYIYILRFRTISRTPMHSYLTHKQVSETQQHTPIHSYKSEFQVVFSSFIHTYSNIIELGILLA